MQNNATVTSSSTGAATSRQLAILFADIAGSTALYHQFGDAHALRLVDSTLSLLERLTAEYGGRVVKKIGDEIMAVFPAIDNALYAASAMQTRLESVPPVGGTRIRIRAGFHSGSVIEDADDVFGDTVNVAARLAGLARAGQIITSEDAMQALPPMLRTVIRTLDRVELRGRSAPVGICEVLWDTADKERTLIGTPDSAAAGAGSLRIVHAAGEFEQTSDQGPVTIGRDDTNTIVLAHARCSREHARIEYRRGKFVLVDSSSNGTFVKPDNGREMIARNEELVLLTGGEIRCGHPARDGLPPDATFRCD